MKVGITGQNGFIGAHLYNTLGLEPETFERIDFDKSFFDDDAALDLFVKNCDVIVHLAAMNRHENPQVIYDNNIQLVQKLISSLERTNSKAHVLFSSSSQEEKDNLYGKSKLEGRNLLANWAQTNGGKFSGMIIPNVFGPFGEPFYNSFIATFCHQLNIGQIPTIQQDAEVNLIYVGELVQEIISEIKEESSHSECKIKSTSSLKVSQILAILQNFKEMYLENGQIPELRTDFEFQLFNTFRSFIDYKNLFPRKYVQHCDDRGAFVELIRMEIGGQCSFSTTKPGITRGNHYHTRKIERFSVIKGKALIQLRKINTDEVLEFTLDGVEPAYVDMPVWYTHNIKNIGTEELLTIFWINEPYNAEDADTYFETV